MNDFVYLKSDRLGSCPTDKGNPFSLPASFERDNLNGLKMEEIWRDIPGYAGYYQVSNYGNVRSCDRRTLAHKNGDLILRYYKGKIKKITRKHSGYCQVTLAVDNCHKRELVHRLVALTFISNPDNKPEINHIDGNKANNNADNLEWVTSSENQIHANNILMAQTGENHPHAIFTNAEVLRIRKLYTIIGSYKEIAEALGVTPSTIRRIVLKETYRYAEICENIS